MCIFMRRRARRSTRTDTPLPYPTLFRSGLVQQLAAADRALLLAYLGNGGLAFTGQYRDALGAYFTHLESGRRPKLADFRSEEHTSELQSLMRISYAVFCLNKKKVIPRHLTHNSLLTLTQLNMQRYY